jgi:hypothetical protein
VQSDDFGLYFPTDQILVQGEIYMKVTFVDVDSDTLYLLPPSIQKWLPENLAA